MIGLDGSRHAAKLDRQMGLGHAAVLARRTHGGRGFRGLAKGLDRNTGSRRDVVVCRRLRIVGQLSWGLRGGADHLPTSLSLALSASG